MKLLEIFIAISAAIGVIMFLIVIVLAFRGRSKELPWENEDDQVSSYHVGMTSDSGNISSPMVRWTLYRDACVVSSVFGTWRLPYPEIASIEYVEAWFSHGVRIRHRVAQAPKELVLWGDDPQNQIKQLRLLVEACGHAAPNTPVPPDAGTLYHYS